MTRKIFYSFHYKPDVTRVAKIRNIGVIEGNRPATDNDWEAVTKGGASAIERWIKEQMYGRSCTVVLVGENTAGRKWINHEIVQSWNECMGIVGIYIHGIKNIQGYFSNKGNNPFDYIDYGNTGKKLSSIVKCYNPDGNSSKERYACISEHLEMIIEEAIKIRKKN